MINIILILLTLYSFILSLITELHAVIHEISTLDVTLRTIDRAFYNFVVVG